MKRWLQMVLFATIVALLANSQCYARCLSSISTSESAQGHSGCHQSSHSKQGHQSRCDHDRQSETATGIEAKVDLTQVPVVYFSPVAALLSGTGGIDLQSRFISSTYLPERASPPDKPLFLSISVFRL